MSNTSDIPEPYNLRFSWFKVDQVDDIWHGYLPAAPYTNQLDRRMVHFVSILDIGIAESLRGPEVNMGLSLKVDNEASPQGIRAFSIYLTSS